MRKIRYPRYPLEMSNFLSFFGGGVVGPSTALFGWTMPTRIDENLPDGSVLSGANLIGVQWQGKQTAPVSAGGSNWLPGAWSRIQWGPIGNYSVGAGIKADGSLWTWGNQNNGNELGQGIATINWFNATPKQIGTSSWAMVAVGGPFMHAIDSLGRLFAWGYNGDGELGLNDLTNRSSPVQVGTSSWSMVACDNIFAAAIRSDGALFTWGFNASGNLGDSTVVTKSSPVKIGASSWNFVSVSSANGGYALAIRIDGGLFTWGDNVAGQLGNGNTTSRSSPVQVGTSSWSFVNCGGKNAAGILTTGALYTWGDNSSGQLGDGTTVAKSSPVHIGTSSWSLVSIAGFDASISGAHAIDSLGRLFGWGDNSHGQVGDGTTTNRSSPVQVGSDSWVWVKTNHLYTNFGTFTGGAVIGIKADSSVWRWGDVEADGIPAYDPFLGDGNGGQLSWAFAGASKVVVSCSGSALCIDATGKLWAWGDNAAGQLGDGTTTSRSSPVAIGALTWKDIYFGGVGAQQHALGILSDGSLYAWGGNGFGQLGDGTTVAKSSPVHIGTSSWSLVPSSCGHCEISGTDNGPTAAAIRTDGALFCWGGNTNGSIGDSTTVAKSSPVKIGASSWSMVSMGGGAGNSAGENYHTAGIDVLGRLLTWGYNLSGQLGDGTAIGKTSPVVIGGSSWSMVSAGTRHTAGLLVTTGALYTWGFNTQGQLGDGTTVAKSSPVHIGTSSWSMINASRQITLGKTTGNQLYWWGIGQNANNGGVNPNLVPTNSSSPVALGSAQNWTQVPQMSVNGVVIGIR